MAQFTFGVQGFPARLNGRFMTLTAVFTATELARNNRQIVEQNDLVIIQMSKDHPRLLAVVGVQPLMPPPSEGPAKLQAWLESQRKNILPSEAGGPAQPAAPKWPAAWARGFPVEASKWIGVTPWPGWRNQAGHPVVHRWEGPFCHASFAGISRAEWVYRVTDIHITGEGQPYE